MSDIVSFGVFDKDAEVDLDRRCLPHWFQPGVATFITFRTADSMPREVVDRWKTEIKSWLATHGLILGVDDLLPSVEEFKQNNQLGKTAERGATTTDDGASGYKGADDGASGYIVHEYARLRTRLWQAFLDECHGECVLRRQDLAEIVLDSLRHFDGDRYSLDSAIVMPNHVHLIAQFWPPTTCRGQCESWLHFTAHQINKRIGRQGAFWRSEPFDHLIRSEEQFLYLRKYIAQNGIVAKLPRSHYSYWSRS